MKRVKKTEEQREGDNENKTAKTATEYIGIEEGMMIPSILSYIHTI